MPIHDRQQRAGLDQLVQDFADYKANRRQFLQRAMAIGLSASAATSLLIACGGGNGNSTSTNAKPTNSTSTNAKPTIVLVHGAFTDASSWDGVTARLQQQCYDVIAPPNPLRGVRSDSAYIASFLNQIHGPILLVAHSYGGAVTSNAAANASNVVGLVYVAALIPEEGERLADMHSKDSIINPLLIVRQYPTGSDGKTTPEFTLDPAHFPRAYAADVPEERARLMAATQRPISAVAFGDTSGPVAWKTRPSWAIIATEDVGAGTDVVRAMAQRAGAKVTELKGSHAILISQPQAVADVILEAAKSVS
jgi:pimeloyl-ACP methyl ester carboxylesterase